MSCQVQPSAWSSPVMLSKVRRSRAGDEQDGDAANVDSHAARERAWLLIGVGFIEHPVIGHGALLDGRVCEGLKNICNCIHDCWSPKVLTSVDEFRGLNPWQ